MKQLTFGDILEFAEVLKKEKGLAEEELKELPVYIGDDDELNGIHCGWALDVVDADTNDENVMYLVDMINEDSGNIKLEKGKAILMS